MDFLARIDNTIDIFCTIRPSFVDRCIPLPVISEHDTVLVDCKVLPAHKKPIRRKIYLWRRANKSAMDQDMTDFTREFVANDTISTPVDSLWNQFKEKCIRSSNTHVPSNLTSTRFSQAWCNRDVRRLSRRKKTAYKQGV